MGLKGEVQRGEEGAERGREGLGVRSAECGVRGKG